MTSVAAVTRDKVFAAMAAIGYQGRRLGATTSGVIELLIEGADSPWALELIKGAERESAARESALIITSSVHEEFSIDRWAEAVRTRRSAGVIAALPSRGTAILQALGTLGTPVVLLDPPHSDVPFPAIRATNWAGGYEATSRLVQLGHRRIGHIAGRNDLDNAVERLEGYAAALRRATQSTIAASSFRCRDTTARNSAGWMSWVLKNLRSPPQEYISDAGSSPRSLAFVFGMMRGSQEMPFTASSLAGILDSSRTVDDALPFWTLMK